MKKIIALLFIVVFSSDVNGQCSISDQSVTATQNLFCPAGGATTIILGDSEIGIEYYLMDDVDNSIVDGPILGTSDSIIFNTGSILSTTTYYVYAEDTLTTTCNTQMVEKATITVEDVLNPVPDVLILADVTGECSVTVSAPTATDNCEGTIIGSTLDPTTYNSQGSYIIYWTYEDSEGNTATQTQNVIITDITPPVPDVTSLPDITDECSVTLTEPTATDNCVGTIVAASTDPLVYNGEGTYSVTWIFDDGNGNITTQSQNVIIDDVTDPVADVINLPDEIDVCSVTISSTPTATDNCAGTIIATTADPLSYTAQGTYIITWTYDDGNGNTATQQQNVIVNSIDTSVTVTSNILTANNISAGVSYQWINCNGNVPISGEMNQNFSPFTDGDYALVVSQNGCSDTSSCYHVIVTGIQKTTKSVSAVVYPNPTFGNIIIDLHTEISGKIIVRDLLGKIIFSNKINSYQMSIDLSDLKEGVYFIDIQTDSNNRVIKVIKY